MIKTLLVKQCLAQVQKFFNQKMVAVEILQHAYIIGHLKQ